MLDFSARRQDTQVRGQRLSFQALPQPCPLHIAGPLAHSQVREARQGGASARCQSSRI
jgi:hypothetical protein